MSPLMGLVITKSALKHIATFPDKIRIQIIKKVRALALEQHPQGSKRLQGITTDEGKPIFKHRSGDYRILYSMRDNSGEVIILDIDHRKNIYRK